MILKNLISKLQEISNEGDNQNKEVRIFCIEENQTFDIEKIYLDTDTDTFVLVEEN